MFSPLVLPVQQSLIKVQTLINFFCVCRRATMFFLASEPATFFLSIFPSPRLSIIKLNKKAYNNNKLEQMQEEEYMYIYIYTRIYGVVNDIKKNAK